MAKNKLYDENDKYTNDSGNLDREVTEALKPIFEKYVEAGYSFRDISHVTLHAVFGLEMEVILTEQVKKIKKLIC